MLTLILSLHTANAADITPEVPLFEASPAIEAPVPPTIAIRQPALRSGLQLAPMPELGAPAALPSGADLTFRRLRRANTTTTVLGTASLLATGVGVIGVATGNQLLTMALLPAPYLSLGAAFSSLAGVRQLENLGRDSGVMWGALAAITGIGVAGAAAVPLIGVVGGGDPRLLYLGLAASVAAPLPALFALSQGGVNRSRIDVHVGMAPTGEPVLGLRGRW